MTIAIYIKFKWYKSNTPYIIAIVCTLPCICFTFNYVFVSKCVAEKTNKTTNVFGEQQIATNSDK